ncbi:MAG: ion channel [Crocosphaera sp.]|nr:ion channel [Crocosphaera sp.]
MSKRFKKVLQLKGYFFPFFVSTLLLSTIYPIFLHSNLGIIFLHIVIILALIAGINLIKFNQILLFIGGTIGCINIILTVLLFIFRESWLIKFSWNLGILSFYILITGCVLILIKKSKQITIDTILGAISGYFTLAIAWGMLFHLIEFLAPGSFKLPPEAIVRPDIFIYFSQITIASVGYGDIIPVTPLARSAAALLGMLGQLYLAVLLGIIIGIYLSNQTC